MVRTKAGNAAVRKAVAAKAPRKQVGGGGVPSVSSPSSGRVRKAKVGSFGNPIKSWPTPAWQKGIDNFLSPTRSKGESSSQSTSSTSDICCSSSTVLSEEHKKAEDRDVTSDGEEIEKETDDSEEEEDLVPESEEESEIDEEETATSKVAMLGKDLATCGSDSDDD